MPVQGYSLPRSPEGRASLVPRPPWHYVGDFLVIEYWADPAAVAAVLPEGLEPNPADPGRAAALFIDWQSCTDGGSQLLDPSRSQYKEFFLVVNALLDGEEVTTCPYIWVDRDFALVRGWVQGFPKKLGSVWMTRTFGLDCLADPGAEAGRRLRRHARRERPPARGGNRHARAGLRRRARPTTTRRSSTSGISRGSRLDATTTRQCTSSSGRGATTASISQIWEGSATLELFAAPNEEHDALAPVRMGKGFRFTFAYTVDDLADGARAVSATATGHRVDVAGVSVSTDHFVGGRAGLERHSLRRTSLRSTSACSREIARASAGDVDQAVQGRPRRLSGLGRARARPGALPYLHRLADLIDANVDQLAAVECEDMAMLLRSLKARVIPRGARNYRAYADLARRLRGARLALERHLEPRPADAVGPRRGDHAVERAVHALDMEDGARARRGLHRRAQAGRMVAARVLAPR